MGEIKEGSLRKNLEREGERLMTEKDTDTWKLGKGIEKIGMIWCIKEWTYKYIIGKKKKALLLTKEKNLTDIRNKEHIWRKF